MNFNRFCDSSQRLFNLTRKSMENHPGSIGYIPRAGETAADLEATATTATLQELLVINNTKNLRWEGVSFQYATWLGASESTGFIDTQSAYLCQEGEPPVNVQIATMFSRTSPRTSYFRTKITQPLLISGIITPIAQAWEIRQTVTFRDADGKCANVSIVNINGSDTWPAPAVAIVANAGRRTGVLLDAVAPMVSPPSPTWPPSKNYTLCNNPASGPPGHHVAGSPPSRADRTRPVSHGCSLPASSRAMERSPTCGYTR